MACSSGACCGETSRAPAAARPILSDRKKLRGEQAARDHGDGDAARAGGEQHADEHDVQRAEQEDGDQHPGLEPGVTAERGLSHRRFIVAMSVSGS